MVLTGARSWNRTLLLCFLTVFPNVCINDTDSWENMLCWLTASLLTCRASAFKKEYRRSFLQYQWRRLDKTLIKTLRSHPRLLSASLPQICWCQIPWQLKRGRYWCNPQAAAELCLPASPRRSPSPKQTSLPCQDITPPPFFYPVAAATLISLSARKPVLLIYLSYLSIYFPHQKTCAVSLATARFINICSHHAQQYSA